MEERDPHRLAQEAEREADALERHGEEVQGAVEETRADWERKRRDEDVPGAPPPDSGTSEDPGQADDA